MALTREQWMTLAGAAAFAVAMPGLLLSIRGTAPVRPTAAPLPTIRPTTAPAVSAIYERSLFVPAEASGSMPTDAPALIGIAGRLNKDAVALVRGEDGSSRSLKLGESVDGWRLESLAIDAAFFVRGRERVRVAMADETEPEEGDDQ